MRRLRDERGSSSVEMAILFPLIVVLLFGGTQAAVWSYGRQVAQSAAQAGVRAASTQGATAGAGQAAAENFLTSSGGNLSAVVITEATTGDRVTVTITGNVPLVIPLPGLTATVRATASRPIEQFTTPGSVP